jgi:putative ABC transport system permease protein
MLKNYFKIAWRNLWENRFYTILNISRVATGLAVGILILIWFLLSGNQSSSCQAGEKY